MRAIGVFAVLTLSAVFVVASAAPAAAAVTITVDPSTDLADGQPVTITGTGFAPGTSVGAAECSAAIATSRNTSDCDLSFSPIVSADSSGTAVIHLRAKRTIVTQNATVDCVTATEPCIIGMADISAISDPEKSGGVKITFDPNAPPPPPPDVSFTPADDLVDRQQVAVYATGFIPGEQVIVNECAATAVAQDPCNQSFQYGGGAGTADPTGAVAVGITVRRAVRVGNDRLDCASAVGACVVVARAIGGPAGTAPLRFDASVPLPPPPTLVVTPADGLGDGQIVQVHGAGFAPGAPVAIFECPSDVTPQFGCYSTYGRSIQPDTHGSFTTAVEVERELQQFGPRGPTPAPTTVDCADSPGRCVLTAFDYSDDLDSASTPLTFDPNKPPAPPPTATASPDTALADGQTVAITADGFPPGSGLFVVECKAGAVDASGCDVGRLGNALADDNGHVEATFVVQRFLTLGPPVEPPPTTVPSGPAASPYGQQSPAAAAFFADDATSPNTIDCASAPGACTLSVAFLGGPEIEAASVPLSFDASAPPTGAPTLPVEQPVDAASDTSTSTTAAPQVEGNVVSRGPLARTGADVRGGLRFDLVLLIAGFLALVLAAGLRARAHRRAPH